ncbi:hypothetical protein Taro_021802 [Colocasia esculenta]|uniref:RNA helicase n=1 Tax=Colocasia esculenta TaxID=4460 RepID=A0A843USJ7_COLES|nr:hypothetical protein [Colocasia esculenta]
MNALVRRSAASATPALRQTLAALLAGEPLRFQAALASAAAPLSASEGSGTYPCGRLVEGKLWLGMCRGFHFSAAPLRFRASAIAGAECAVDDAPFWEDERSNRDESLEISRLGIAPEIATTLATRGITKLFPIQRAVLEPAMQGRDMIGRARTGTGKTLAFGIPIMDKTIKFNEKNGRGVNPLALVLAPTRELARQVEKEFTESTRSLDTLCVYGGSPIGQQMRTLQYGVDVVVGTPGRVGDSDQKLAEGITLYSIASDNYGKPSIIGPLITEHAKGGKCIVFTQTKRDADRLAYCMARSYKCEALHGDISQSQRERTLAGFRDGCFNILVATDVAARGLDIPNVDLTVKTTALVISHRGKARRHLTLVEMDQLQLLTSPLQISVDASAIDSWRCRWDSSGRFSVRSAYSIMSDGGLCQLAAPYVWNTKSPLKVKVIHYELPTTSEIFVHRSGRTGRAGKRGSAILIYTEQQTRAVRQIENDVGCRFNELPRIKAESGMDDFFVGMRGGPSSSFGGSRMSNPGFSRPGDLGRSGFGRSSSFGGGGLGRSGDFSSNRMGEYGGSGQGRFGSFRPPGPGLSGGFGNSGQHSGFGQSGSGFADCRTGSACGLGGAGMGSGGHGSGSTGAVGNSSPGLFGGSDSFGSGLSAFSSGLGSSHLSRRVDSGSSSSSGFGDSGSGQLHRHDNFSSGRLSHL